MNRFSGPEQHGEDKATFLAFNESGVIINNFVTAKQVVNLVKDIAPELAAIVDDQASAEIKGAVTDEQKLTLAFVDDAGVKLGLEHFPALAIGFHRLSEETTSELKTYKESCKAFGKQIETEGPDSDFLAVFKKCELLKSTTSRDELLAVMPLAMRAGVIEQMFQ